VGLRAGPGRCGKSRLPPGLDPRTDQPVDSRYTDYATVLKYIYIGCPIRYRTRHFFNNSNANEDIATKFEQEYVHCVRNEKECVCSVCL